MEDLIKELLKKMGEDPNRKGLIGTPKRVSKMYKFLTQGYGQDIQEIVNDALYATEGSEMIVVRDIEFFSMCEHHMIPFFGRCHAGYLPNKHIIGLSKIPRIVDAFSQRLQAQERLVSQIAETLMNILNPIGVGVIMEGRHLCMQMRGVKKQNCFATTSAMLGQFRNSAKTRSEFLSIVGMKKL